MNRIACLLVAAALAACSRGERARTEEVAPEPLAIAPTAQPDEPKDKGYVGVLTPREAVEITAPFTTNVDEYLVKLGDHVDAGAPLARLDERPLREQLEVARAELAGSKAQVAQAGAARRAAKRRVRDAEKGVRSGITSTSEMADAQFKSQEAGAVVGQALATVEQQKARIAALEKKLEDMTLASPIAGKVALRYVEAGHRVDEGRPVIRVISSDELFVKFAIPSERVGTLAVGDKVDVFIEAQGVTVAATVRSVAPELDPVAQMILGEAELAAPATGDLQSGMVCRVIPPAPRTSALEPPASPPAAKP